MQKTQIEKTGKPNEEQWLECDVDSKGREKLNFFVVFQEKFLQANRLGRKQITFIVEKIMRFKKQGLI